MKKIFTFVLALMLLSATFNVGVVNDKVHASGYEFNVDFDVNEGTPSIDNQTIPSEKETIDEPESPSKDGYYFVGWKVKGTEHFIDFSKEARCVGNESVEYYAKDGNKYSIDNTTLKLVAYYLKKEPLKVIFNTDGGSAAPESQIVNEGEKILEPEAPVKEGYVFKWWSSKMIPNGYQHNRIDFDSPVKINYNEGSKNIYNGVIYFSTRPGGGGGGLFTGMGQDLEIIAIYEEAPVTHKVVFNTDGGEPVPDVQELAEDQAIFKPEDPKKDGYTFEYWALDGERAPDFSLITVQEDLTFKAVYKEDKKEETKTYKVSFDADGGTPVPPVQEVEENGRPEYPTEPRKVGFVFDYWALDGERTPDFSLITVQEDLTFKAVYKKAEKKIFEVRFDTAGGSPVPDSKAVFEGDMVDEPDTDPAKEGYTFTAWYDAEGEYDFEAPVKRDMILYAKYKKDGESHNNSHRQDIDIDDKDYDKAIMKYKKAFFEGYPDGTFKPEATISRAEMATVFYRILDLENMDLGNTKSFNDIDGHWAKDKILKVAEYGLLNGYPDGSFKPDGKMTRAEIAAIINKYWNLKGFEPRLEDANVSDIDKHWAKDMILALYNHRFVDLYKDKSFKPDSPLKRADVAQILNRITDRPLIDVSVQKFSDVPAHHWAYKEVGTAASESK